MDLEGKRKKKWVTQTKIPGTKIPGDENSWGRKFRDEISGIQPTHIVSELENYIQRGFQTKTYLR